MRGRSLRLIEGIRASYWFIPALMTIGAVMLAVLTVWLDRTGRSDWIFGFGFVDLNEAEGARSLLSTIAGSMINVAGVVFSLTMVTLTLASQQFGPRLLGNFMRDRVNQVVLGTFISTFLYCLLVLRTVRSGGQEQEVFVPHLSITVALLITLATLAALIFFIHHIASSIQVENVIGRVARTLGRQIAPGEESGIFPAGVGQGLRRAVGPGEWERPLRSVVAKESGYLQAIDGGAIIRLAKENGAIVRLTLRPGAFVMHGAHVMDVDPPDLPDEVVARLLGTLSFGTGRGTSDDLDALFDQLLELSLRALSPAVNNPITANACVDWICDALLQLGRHELPSPYRADEEGALRLVVPDLDLPALAHRQFSSLRSGLASSLLAASHAATRLEQLHRRTDHEGLANAAMHEWKELMAACREEMGAPDNRTLRP